MKNAKEGMFQWSQKSKPEIKKIPNINNSKR